MEKIKDGHKRVFDIRKFKFDINKRIDLHQFTHIRGYHGCRVRDRESYRKNGLHCFTYEKAWEQCQLAFVGIDVSCDALRQVFDKTWNDRYKNELDQSVYFLLNKEGFNDRCGDYVRLGSEFLNAVASKLCSSKKYKQFLDNIGIPSVITCDVPSKEIIPCFFNSMEELLNTNCIPDFSAFAVKYVAPENIVSIRRYKGWISYWVEGEGEYRIHLE